MVAAGRAVARARRQEDKEERRRTILEAALALVARQRFVEVKMSDVASAAGLAKGTVFLYFPTKEALFLAILEDELESWLAALDHALDTGRGPFTSARVARLLTETLAARDVFVRLLGLFSSVLEQNVELDRVIAFKRRLRELLAATGARLERRLDFLAGGQGAHLLLQVYAVVVGVEQLTDPGPVARRALEEADLQPLALDFASELGSLLLAVLTGLEHRNRPRG